MANGVDCATPLTTTLAGKFAADGNAFVGRYLVPSGWKRLTREEAETISNAGLQIISVFETTANRALGGRMAGLEDGAIVCQVAAEVGQPKGSCIYFAVDFDATVVQMATIIEYIRACGEATPDFATGAYGSYAVIEALKQANVCSHFWQTIGWSRGLKAEGINIFQSRNDITLHGIGVDLDQSFGNEGWWNTLEVENDMSVEDANQLIELLKGVYGAGLGQDEVHRLANVLRKASGQPEE